MRERIQLWNQVGGLEEKLSGLSQGFLSADQLTEISALKEVILTQERSISDLLQSVKEQTEELDGQKNKIKSLEKKLNPDRLQETLPKYSWDGELSSVSGYRSSFSSDGSFSSDFQRDCGEIFSSGEKSSGLYPVKPNGSEVFLVYCEFTEEATFNVLQRRRGGAVDFNQPRKSYEDGFGDFRSEFWLGLRKIFSIPRPSGSLLHIHIENWNQEKHVMEFQYMLEGPDSNYTIHLNTGADVPTIMRFSTEEHNDGNRPKAPHCADDHTGGWWFSALGDVNLNGKCIQIQFGKKGVHGKWDNGGQSRLKYTQISIRHR